MTTRREFLAWTAATVGISTLSASPVDPFKRMGRPVLKLSLAADSMRKFLDAAAVDRKMDLLGFLDYCATLGLQGAEPTSYYFPKEITPEYLNDLKRHAQLRGLDLSGGAIRNDFCRKPGP